MKPLTCLIMMVALTAPLLAQSPTPTGAEAQAQQELNEAARAYRQGKYKEAQAHAERALLLDPQSKSAPMYLARTIHAQYRPLNFAPENVAKAREAIVAYQKILERSPDNDEVYKAVAYLYEAIKEDELLQAWILQRAENVFFANDKRAEAFVALASKDWDCSFRITDLPANKVTTVRGTRTDVRYQMPKEQSEFERAKECANRGLERVNSAITLTPESDTAWAYKQTFSWSCRSWLK